MLSSTKTKIHICLKCQTEYKHASSLSRHKHKCSGVNKKKPISVQTTEFEIFKLDVMKQMDELNKQIEILKLEDDLNKSRLEFKMLRE